MPIETAPGAGQTADPRNQVPGLALAIVYSRSEPHRLGEVAPVPAFKTRVLGRREREVPAGSLHFYPQRPGDSPPPASYDGRLLGDSISHQQVRFTATPVAIEVESIGRLRMYINGVECTRGRLVPGNTLMLEGAVVLVCIRRHKTMPALERVRAGHAFGLEDENEIVGESAGAWALREALALAADRDDNTLLHGESGTGKEMAAWVIHHASRRAGRPFLTRNASSFTQSISEAQLGGHLANYPNPGMPARKGVLPEAHLGTLFFDEITDCPYNVQTQLLRVLDSGEYTVLGDPVTRTVDVRIVGATNSDDARFRTDFRARLRRHVYLPPLRERPEDIALLIQHLLLRYAAKHPELARFLEIGPTGRTHVRISGRLVDYLVRHPLPTNVRQLDELVVAAADASHGDTVRMFSLNATPEPSSLPVLLPVLEAKPAPRPPASAEVSEPREARETPSAEKPAKRRAAEPTKEEVVAALKDAGSVRGAAEILSLSRQQVYRLIAKHDIEWKGAA